MSQYDQIFESLNDLGYTSTSLSIENVDVLKNIVETNLVEFSKIVAHLSRHLSVLSNFDENVNAIESSADESTFYLEICSFLKEISCPYRSLLEGPIDERYRSVESKLNLLDFLATELQAARIIASNKPQIVENLTNQRTNESEETKALKKILITLGFPKPPSTVTIQEIWAKVESQLTQLLSKLPKDYLGKPLLSVLLNDVQWQKLMNINHKLCEDFQMRRELLLTRLDVTIQSFKWADRLKQNNNEIANLYQQRRKELSIKQNVKIYDILAARDDLCKQEKTCSTRLMTRSQLHKLIIPAVPDRGGRTGELQPPPPEMPAFAQRTFVPQQQQQQYQPQGQRQQQQGRGGYGGGQGGGRGGGQGNKWSNDNNNHRSQSDYERYQNQDYGNGGGGGYGGGGYGGGGGGGGGYGGGGGGRGGHRGGRGGGNRY